MKSHSINFRKFRRKKTAFSAWVNETFFYSDQAHSTHSRRNPVKYVGDFDRNAMKRTFRELRTKNGFLTVNENIYVNDGMYRPVKISKNSVF